MTDRARRLALALLAVALILAMTTWFSASAVIPQLRAEWHLSSTAASWLTIAVQLGFVTGALASSVPPTLIRIVAPIPAWIALWTAGACTNGSKARPR